MNGFFCVYLTKEYFKYFSGFFPCKFTNFSDPEIESITEEYYSRVKFLKEYVHIEHKGNIAIPCINYRNLLSDPYIERIVMYYDFNKAKVYFSVGCGYWEALLEKTNDSWVLMNCRLLMIC